MKLSQKARSTTHRVVLWGPPKSGKTELAGKLAEKYKLIWFDLEGGYATLTKFPEEWQERIELIQIPDSRVMPMAVETMLKVIKGTACNICEDHGKVECAICKKENRPITRVCLNEVGADTVVVVDSLTQYSVSAIANITKTQPDDYKMQHDDWGNLKTLVEKFLTQVQAAKYNMVCITHEEEVELEDGKKKLVPVCGSSKSSRNTAKYFDHSIYVEVKNKKHVAGSSTAYANNMMTGSRTDVELEKSAEPTLLDIFTSWKTGFTMPKEEREAYAKATEIVKAIIPDEVETATITAAIKSPGQIALENMKAKMSGGKS